MRILPFRISSVKNPFVGMPVPRNRSHTFWTSVVLPIPRKDEPHSLLNHRLLLLLLHFDRTTMLKNVIQNINNHDYIILNVNYISLRRLACEEVGLYYDQKNELERYNTSK